MNVCRQTGYDHMYLLISACSMMNTKNSYLFFMNLAFVKGERKPLLKESHKKSILQFVTTQLGDKAELWKKVLMG